MPNETLSLQHILFTYLEQKHWYTQQQKLIIQTWVDETGAPIQEDTQYQIKHQTACDITDCHSSKSPKQEIQVLGDCGWTSQNVNGAAGQGVRFV